MDSEAPVKNFLHNVAEGKFASLDMQNRVEELTALNPQKLKRLEEDLKKTKYEEGRKVENRMNHYKELEALLKELRNTAASEKLIQEDYALICALNDEQITKYITAPSKKLLQHCGFYKDKDRCTALNDTTTFTVANNKLKRYEKVSPYLNEDGGRRAEDHIKIIKAQMEELGIIK